MNCRIGDLRCREVVNVCDGQRMGFIEDVLLDSASGQILAVVIPGPCKLLGLFGREDDYVIPWECIRKLGPEIVLVEVSGPYRREKRPHRKFF